MQQQMVMMQDEFQTKGQNTQWADIVSQAVDTKFEMVKSLLNKPNKRHLSSKIKKIEETT